MLFGGSLFTIYAGVYYWFPKMTGRMFDERLGKLHFWLTFVVFNLTFGADAPDRRPGDAAARRRLPGAVRGLEPVHLARARSCSGSRRWSSSTTWSPRWRGGPRAPANPWRSLTLEWQVSSPPPIFNFDRVPTVVGGPYEYGVPGAVHGIFQPRRGGAAKARQPARRRPSRRGGDSRWRTILVLANETIGGSSCSTRSGSARRAGDARFHVVVPADAPAPRQRHLRRGRARLARRCASTWRSRSCATTGIEGTGEVGDPDPFNAAMDAIARAAIDEIIVSTLPATTSGWLRRDLPERLAGGAGLPVEHVVVDLDNEGLPFDVTLVVANQTAAGAGAGRAPEALAERGRRTASSSSSRRTAATGHARREAARERLASAAGLAATTHGIVAAGMIGDPDPYTAIMNAAAVLPHLRDRHLDAARGRARGGWPTSSSSACASATQHAASSTSSRARPRGGEAA